MHACAAHDKGAVVERPPLRHGDLALAGQELARHRAGGPFDFLRLPFGDDVAAVLTRAGTHVDEPVGRPHHLLVVLHHEHGVTEVAQPLEGGDEPPVVALMEPDRGLVEDVEDADEL